MIKYFRTHRKFLDLSKNFFCVKMISKCFGTAAPAMWLDTTSWRLTPSINLWEMPMMTNFFLLLFIFPEMIGCFYANVRLH